MHGHKSPPAPAPRSVDFLAAAPYSDEWFKEERIIAKEFRAKPWEFYCIKPPDEPAENFWDVRAKQRWAAFAAAAAR